jgi:hypothetical protein
MVVLDNSPAAGWRQGETKAGTLRLKDGRVYPVRLKLLPPRPRISLVARSVRRDGEGTSHPITLGDPTDVPLGSVLTFSIRAESPARFPRSAYVEVAATDGAFQTRLELANGGLALVDASLAIATLDPAQAFGPSAFGLLQFRVGNGEDVGDWQPLGRLVRLPVLKRLSCRADGESRCELAGSKLFLVESVSTSAQFTEAVKLPDGFPGFSIAVPRPADGRLYLKLRDDPEAVNVVKFAPGDAKSAD